MINTKILLINPPFRTWSAPNCFPLGLGYLVSVMGREDVDVLDINALRLPQGAVRGFLKLERYSVYGITGLITSYNYIKWLCKTIREVQPQCLIVLGGPIASAIPEILLQETEADICCIGEGEMTFFKLCSAVKYNVPYFGIPGIAYRGQLGTVVNPRAEPIKLHQLPLPAWDRFPMEVYLKNPIGAVNLNKWKDGAGDGTLSMNVSATRGCPYNCIYCFHDFMGIKYRTRPADHVFNEIKFLLDRYGVEYIHFVDDEFCLDKEFVYDFCERMIRSGLGNVVTWGCTGRVNLADPNLYKMMKTAGCVEVSYGIESGSQQILDTMRKGVKVDQARKALKMTKSIFGHNNFSIMVGMIGETEETLAETHAFIQEVGKPEVVFFCTPYPKTQLWKMVDIKDPVDYISKLDEQGRQISVNLTNLPDETLIKWQKLIQG